MEVLTKDHWGLETFVGISYDKIIYVICEVQLAEDIKARNVIKSDVVYHLEPRLSNREISTLALWVYTLKSEVECLRGRLSVLRVWNILLRIIIIIVNHNLLTTECINVIFGHSDTATARSKDRWGSLFILLIYEPVYSVLQRHGFRLHCRRGFQLFLFSSPAFLML